MQEGSVNFDAGIVAQHAVDQAAEVQAQPEQSDVAFGARLVGEAQSGDAVEVAPEVKQPIQFHAISYNFLLTLGLGFTPLKGHGKALRNVEAVVDGQPFAYNFYNPFTKNDVAKDSGEGLMRHLFSKVAARANETAGAQLRFVGVDTDVAIAELMEELRSWILSQFPAPSDYRLFDIPMELEEGTFDRPVTFGELFDVSVWETPYESEGGVMVHDYTINFGINAGAFYDSKEPAKFVANAKTFVERNFAHLGLDLPARIAVSLDGESLNDGLVRDLIEDLTAGGFSVVSRSTVVAGKVDFLVPPTQADKLFGPYCDLILLSGSEEESDEEESAE